DTVATETTTAVQLVKVSYDEDTSVSFQTFQPDELATINNLETSTAMTIHNYQDPDETPRFGFYKYSASTHGTSVRIWSYENDTKVYKETYPNNILTLHTTLQRYHKIESYTFANGETLFSNKPLSVGFQGNTQRLMNLSHARGKVFLGNSRQTANVLHIVSHYDNNTVKYQTSTSQSQQTTILSKNEEFTFVSALTNTTFDFWTIQSTEDISVFATGGVRDHDNFFPAQNINDQGILFGLQNTPCITIWDTANPTGTNPTYELIVNYANTTTDTTYTSQGKTISLANQNYISTFARAYLTGNTPSTVYIYASSEGDGSGSDSTCAIPIKFLSSRIQFDISPDSPSHISHVAFGIQFTSGATDTLEEYDTTLSFTGEATPTFLQTITPNTNNTQPDGTKLLHYLLGNDIDRHLYDSTNTTTLFYIITQHGSGKEEAVVGTCDGVRSVENASEYTINSRTALSLNHSGLSQNIGNALSGIYDTTPFGITTLAVFSRNNTEMNNPWFKLSGHSSYFSIVRYSNTNNISLQFRGLTYVPQILINFNFSALTNTDNHLVWGSVKQIGTTEEYELHCELWSFTTSSSGTLVDSQTATITLAYDNTDASFSETDYLVGMDINTGNPIDKSDYASITIGETRYYKGNFTTADKDQLIEDIITYWET
ncbi:MAG: hypothetical protein ACYS26_14445, partial [Planctomycetota bacterium]